MIKIDLVAGMRWFLSTYTARPKADQKRVSNGVSPSFCKLAAWRIKSGGTGQVMLTGPSH